MASDAGSLSMVPPSDEYMHEVDAASNFNESMYFNVYDAAGSLAAFFRLGNRPNEGHAEMTVAVYLPDGSAAFMYDRPAISGNERFDAGGLAFTVDEPFARLGVAYDGEVLELANPLALLDPKAAFKTSPRTSCRVELRVSDVAPAWGGELGTSDALLDDFWRGHYEAHSRVTGTIAVGDRSWTVDGYGLRDHSWGPRTWQSIWWYRWLTANVERDGFILSLIGSPSGSPRVGGAVLLDGRYEPALDVTVESAWSDDGLHQSLEVQVRTASATHEIAGRVLSMIPLRHRREGPDGPEVARIGEGLTEWTWGGRTGYGLSEYLDRTVDGRPVGAGG
jgi:hypothetical protein